MEEVLWKIFEVCAFVALVFAFIVLNFWAIMECYGKILIMCSIMKVLFCVSCLFASICIICLVIVALFVNED